MVLVSSPTCLHCIHRVCYIFFFKIRCFMLVVGLHLSVWKFFSKKRKENSSWHNWSLPFSNCIQLSSFWKPILNPAQRRPEHSSMACPNPLIPWEGGPSRCEIPSGMRSLQVRSSWLGLQACLQSGEHMLPGRGNGRMIEVAPWTGRLRLRCIFCLQ